MPVPTVDPLPPSPLATDSDAAFDAKAFPFFAAWNTYRTQMIALGVFTEEQADAALAAAVAGGTLPSLAGKALQYLRVNAAADGVEFGNVVENIPTQTQAAWNTGTSTAESLISADKLDAKIENKLNVTGPAPLYACRAWVNFDGTTTPPTIRASGNVASVTKVSTGNYIINFTNAMPDQNYAFAGNVQTISGVDAISLMEASAGRSTTSLRVLTKEGATNRDVTTVCVSIFR